MNTYFLIAGLLCFVLGLVHSILGELLIFKHKRSKGNIIPNVATLDLNGRHLRILWATWHLASFFGWSIGALLVQIAFQPDSIYEQFVSKLLFPIGTAMIAGAFLVLVSTKGKHPGWIVLFLIGALIFLGQ